MKAIHLLTLVIGLVSVLAAHATPKLGAVAQVGPPAGPGQHRVLILWQPIEGYQMASAYSVYRKSGEASSTAEFELLSVVQATSHVPTLEFILQDAASAGLSLVELDGAMDTVLGAEIPGASLAEKIALALSTNLPPGRARLFHDHLPRANPALALALGRGYLATVPDSEVSTFELREYLLHNGTEGEVVASLTTGLEPSLISAPGAMSESVDASPKGHLLVRLRWCTPPTLARQSLHVAGYQVYRADRDAWQAAHGSPPPNALPPEELASAIASGLLVPVNRHPVTPHLTYSCLGPVPDDFFLTDENDSAEVLRHEPGGVPFVPGQQVAYYVCALDHFRRPGIPSRVLNVTVCDRMPPNVPRQLRVENRPTYDEATQTGGETLVLSWERDPEISHYWIYRWNSHDDALRHAANPSVSNLLVRLENIGEGERLAFVDDGSVQLPTAPPAPSLPGDAGHTFWYTVRAERPAACPDPEGIGNLSGPGAPAFGVLRNWIGPAAPGGRLVTPCCEVAASFTAITGQLADTHEARVEFVTDNPRITWVTLREAVSGTSLGTFQLRHDGLSPVPPLDLSSFPSFRLEARFGTSGGDISPWVPGLVLNATGKVPLHRWSAAVACGPRAGGCDGGFADPVDPGSGDLTGICGELSAPTGGVEWRVYRRVDGHSRLVQIESGKFPDNSWCDSGTPAVPATLCYYAQAFDADGNPSAITRLGCVATLGTEPMPKPEITHAVVLPANTPAPVIVPASVEWFCPPAGVEFFEIAVAPPPPSSPTTAWLVVPGAQEAIGTDYGVFTSPRIPAGFGGGGPVFAQALGLVSAETYRVRVRAMRSHIAEDGAVFTAQGPWSDEVLVSQVQGVAGQGPQVPWPARPVPPVHPTISPRAEYDLQDEIGRVEIGTIEAEDVLSSPGGSTPVVIRGESLQPYLTVSLPFAAYRHQTSTPRRGEMTQISPLFREFQGTVSQTASGPILAVTDRFIVIKRRNDEPNGPFRIWLRDTQPVMRGQAYRYTIVRHHPDLEIAEVLASTEANVPN